MSKHATTRHRKAAAARRAQARAQSLSARVSQPATPVEGIRIEAARPADAGAYVPLMAAATVGEVLPKGVDQILTLPAGPLTHGPALCLIAR